MYDSCFLAMGCSSESTKLEIRSVGPPLPETTGLPTGTFCEFLSVCQRIPVFVVFYAWPFVNHLLVILSMCPEW